MRADIAVERYPIMADRSHGQASQAFGNYGARSMILVLSSRRILPEGPGQAEGLVHFTARSRSVTPSSL